MSTRDCNVLVVGASGAVGRAILAELQRRSVQILATCRHEPQPSTRDCTWVRFDATEAGGSCDLTSLIAERIEELHAFVYCIAVPSSKRSIVETSEDEWGLSFAVNTIGFARAYIAAAPALRRGRARVVALGSDATRTVGAQNAPYTASKVALEALCHTLAKEESQFGVRINVLAPSLVDSPLANHVLRLKGVTDRDAYAAGLPWGRMLSTSEVAQAAVSLALDQQWGYASGHIIRLSSVG